MGLFSRRDKAPKADAHIETSQSSTSVNSANSRAMNRTSAASAVPGTPLSPMSPVKLPKIDMPRPPDPQLDPAGYLRSLGAVRDRSSILMTKAAKNSLKHFDVDFTKLPDVVAFVSGLIRVNKLSRFSNAVHKLTNWPSHSVTTTRPSPQFLPTADTSISA